MVIQFYMIRNFGRDDRYALDKHIAKAIELISGKKIITDEIMQGFKMLNVTFEEVVPPRK